MKKISAQNFAFQTEVEQNSRKVFWKRETKLRESQLDGHEDKLSYEQVVFEKLRKI